MPRLELVTEARQTLQTWLCRRGGSLEEVIFPSGVNYMGHLSTRQYAGLVDEWVGQLTSMCVNTGRTQYAERRRC
jgi:hypothetical protein